MTIKVGDKIPSATLRRLTDSGVQEINTAEFFKGRKVVAFFVPGAFTPTCHKTHLPGYLEQAAKIKAKGVDEIVCIAVNDVHVMKAWGEATGATGKVTLLSDGSAEFTKALGLELDLIAKGLGVRTQRSSMVVEDGTVKQLNIEPPGGMEISGAGVCLTQL